MKQFSLIVAIVAFMMWSCPAMGQSHDGKMCQFINIDKTVRAKLGQGEDAEYQYNSLKAFWPVMLNGRECTKLQEEFCKWMTGKDDIKQLDRAVENMLYSDNESVPFGDKGPYIILDTFDHVESFISAYSCTIELKKLGQRFALFHLLSNMYFAGAAHGMYNHNYITYDTELDKIVTLKDVLIDPEIIRPYILKSIELKFDYTEDDLFLPDDKIPPIPNVFYFEDGFLHLVYQPYEIASYAQGDIDVPLFYPNDPSAPEYLTPYGKQVMEESVEDDLW